METITVSPYRYVKSGAVVRSTSSTGFKSPAHRLCEAVGLRYVGRAHGYVGTSAQAARVERLHAAGWDAHTIIFKDQDWPGPVQDLPEPWMRRRAGIWIPPAGA